MLIPFDSSYLTRRSSLPCGPGGGFNRFAHSAGPTCRVDRCWLHDVKPYYYPMNELHRRSASIKRNDESNQRIEFKNDPKTTNSEFLKPLLGALGPSLVGLGGVSGCSWEVLGRLGRVLGGSWAALGGSWALLGRSWRPF
jgi:hypothetical protein